MKLSIFIALGLITLGLVLAVNSQARSTVAYHPIAETRTVLFINQIREQHGLKPLVLDQRLSTRARLHSRNMLTLGYFEHDGPDGTFVGRLGPLNRAYIAENIAYGSGPYSKASGFVTGWMHSAGHRHIILLPNLHRIGVGVAYGTWRGRAGIGMATADFSS